MPAALLELAHSGAAAAAEKDDRFSHHRAIFGEAERQRIDSGAPCDVGGRAAEKGDGIGEARAVHVELQPLALRDRADLSDLVGAPGQPIFGRVGDADRRRLDLMHVLPDSRDPRFQRGGVDLRAAPR